MTGATTDSMEEIRAQLQEEETRAAFIAWFEQRYPLRTNQAVRFADKPSLGLWQAFCASTQGKGVQTVTAEDVPIVDGSTIVLEALKARQRKLAEVVQPTPPLEAAPLVPVPVEEFDGPGIPMVTPQAFRPSTNGHKPATQTALFDLLAQGLQEHGFKAQPDLDLNYVTEIASEAARLEIERLVNSRRLTTTLEVTINETPAVVLDEQTPAWFARALKLAAARVNVLLIGPAGSGKSYGARLIAKGLGLPYTPISLSGGTDEGVLIGWLLPVGEGGRFEYVESAFVHAYEHGGVVLLDEIDAADPNVLLVVNEALSNGHFPVPLRQGNPVAERHPDFVCLAAANTHGHGADRVYVGRNQLDGATLSRFRMGQINVDFDEAMERALYAEPAYLYGQRLRARCRAVRGWTRDVSTRDVATASTLLQAGVMGPAEAFYQYFADWSAADVGKVDVVLDHGACTAILR